jgi:NADPH:quinone reductase-like Zn-dependent oxidoreductase
VKTLQIASYGDTPNIVDIDKPSPGAGEVLIRVAGAAANPLDLKIAAGSMHDYFPVTFPYTLGTDVSGTIAALGADVTGWASGDEIVARLDPCVGGAFAEFVIVPADQLAEAPKSVSLPVAAGLVTAAATAWQALTEVATLKPGDRVLIHAAAGGVGSFAVQFAARFGTHVIATASGNGLQLATDLGAHEVVDYTAAPFETKVTDVDVVVDTIGGDNEARSLDVLKSGGLLIATPVPPDTDRAAARGLRAEFVFHSSDTTRLAKVVAEIDDGVQILLDRQFELVDAKAAFDHLADGHAKGKIIAHPSSFDT